MKKGLSALLFLLLILLLCACSGNEPAKKPSQAETGNVGENETLLPDTNHYELEIDDAPSGTVDIHDPRQRTFFNDVMTTLPDGATGNNEIGRPKGLYFSWSLYKNGYDCTDAITSLLSISECEDMTDALVCSVKNVMEYRLYNLKLDTVYYWQLEILNANGQRIAQSKTGQFKTDKTPARNLFVDGVKNCRDLGGWPTADGKTLNQGLIFRTGRLNKSSSTNPEKEITADGELTLLSVLNVKTEIDVRRTDNNEVGGLTNTGVVKGIAYKQVPMPWKFTTGDILTNNSAQIVKFFALLGDEDNYPLFFHCNIGTDRTGMLSFLILSLCGVERNYLVNDYLFSCFSNIGSVKKASTIDTYISEVNRGKPTLKENVYDYLLSIGCQASDLNTLIRLMTE